MWSKHPSDDDMALFCRQLAQLLEAGIPLLEALQFLAKHGRGKNLNLYTALMEALKEGRSLSQGLRKNRYPSFLGFLVLASEHHGQLADTLKWAGRYYTQKHQRTKKLRKAIAYPLLILVSVLLTCWLILSLLLPRFHSLYQTLQVDLPASTRFLLFLGNHWMGIQLAGGMSLLFSALLGFYLFRHKRHRVERMLLNLPFLSRYLKLHLTCTVAIQTGYLLESGVSLINACELFTREAHWLAVRQAFRQIHDELQEGIPFSRAVAGCPLFLPILPEILTLAEQSGLMGASLMKTGEQLEEELGQWLERSTEMLEALITIGSGGLVFLMMLALFVPLFHLISQF